MGSDCSRRSLVKGLASTTLLPSLALGAVGSGMPGEGPDTPKLCAPIAWQNLGEAAIRRVRQIGVNYVLTGGPHIPWNEAELRAFMSKLEAGGLKLGNMMIAGFPKTIFGRTGRDEEIENVRKSIRVAGKTGLPVVEYNFYAHRAIEGYYEETGRAGAGLTAFDYDRMKNLPPASRRRSPYARRDVGKYHVFSEGGNPSR